MQASLSTSNFAHIPFTEGVSWEVVRSPCDDEPVSRCNDCCGVFCFINEWAEYLFTLILSWCSSSYLASEMPVWNRTVKVHSVEETFTFDPNPIAFSQLLSYVAQMAGQYFDSSEKEPGSEALTASSFHVTTIFKDGVAVRCEGTSRDRTQAMIEKHMYDANVDMPLLNDVVFYGTSISACMDQSEIDRVLLGSLKQMQVQRKEEQEEALKILRSLVQKFIYKKEGLEPLSECGVVRISSDPDLFMAKSVGYENGIPDRVSMNLGNLLRRLEGEPRPFPGEGQRDYTYEFFEVVIPKLKDEVESTSKGKFTLGCLVTSSGGSCKYVVEFMRKKT